MVAKVLGKVTQSHDRPRGPDAKMRMQVPIEWIDMGATVEIELPRNLPCAVCEGGGCDACERSGAVSLRGRKEPTELLEVTLPQRPPDDTLDDSGHKGIVVRIPDRGGLPEEGTDLPRGNLLLAVRPGSEADAGVARIRLTVQPAEEPSVPSVAPPRDSSIRPAPPSRPSSVVQFMMGGAMAVIAWLLWRALQAMLN